MKTTILLFINACVLLLFCTKESRNPFFTEWNTPFGTPPLEKIMEEHYLPAFQEGIQQSQKEIEAIAGNTEVPSFENTLEAMEESGALLTKVSNVFDVLNGTSR